MVRRIPFPKKSAPNSRFVGSFWGVPMASATAHWLFWSRGHTLNPPRSPTVSLRPNLQGVSLDLSALKSRISIRWRFVTADEASPGTSTVVGSFSPYQIRRENRLSPAIFDRKAIMHQERKKSQTQQQRLVRLDAQIANQKRGDFKSR